MGALTAVTLVVWGAVLVAEQGPPPGTTPEAKLGWTLAAVGVLGVLAAAGRWNRRQHRLELEAQHTVGTEWFWGPLDTGEDPLGIADPTNDRARAAALRRALANPLLTWGPGITAPR